MYARIRPSTSTPTTSADSILRATDFVGTGVEYRQESPANAAVYDAGVAMPDRSSRSTSCMSAAGRGSGSIASCTLSSLKLSIALEAGDRDRADGSPRSGNHHAALSNMAGSATNRAIIATIASTTNTTPSPNAHFRPRSRSVVRRSRFITPIFANSAASQAAPGDDAFVEVGDVHQPDSQTPTNCSVRPASGLKGHHGRHPISASTGDPPRTRTSLSESMRRKPRFSSRRSIAAVPKAASWFTTITGASVGGQALRVHLPPGGS